MFFIRAGELPVEAGENVIFWVVCAFDVFFCDMGLVFELVEPSVASVVGCVEFCVEGYAAVNLDVAGLEVGVVCHVVATAGVADYKDAWI